MKIFSCLIAYAMMAVFSLSLLSCGGDDEESNVSTPSDESIQINGRTYPINPYIFQEGYWDKEDNEGTFTVSVLEKVGSSHDCLYYVFKYTDAKQPIIGDNFAEKNLFLEAQDGSDAIFETLGCENGFAKVVSIDKERGMITIYFRNLKMTGGKYSYTFNGTVTVHFNYGRTSWR